MADPVSELDIRPEPWGSPVADALVLALDVDLDERYAEETAEVEHDLHHIDAASVSPPGGQFLVAWLGEEAVGCGAIRQSIFESTGEIKRMYVTPAARGKGVSRALLAGLEDAARQLGYHRMVLETGVNQPEALALYESAGYTPIDAYGAFRASPLSRCYERVLSHPNPPSSAS